MRLPTALRPTVGDDDARGPAPAPPTPRHGLLPTVVAAVRLPGDLLLALGYVVRQLPFLVQDLRSLVNDLARLAHVGDPGALSDLVAGLARAASTEGELTRLLRAAAELAEARAEVERGQTPET
ncbi:hypothetical protein [Egicoccus halophilus]|uniref:Uncharacterized protein n=1 Tax=Egicoccus halophilus TaxID=1670830 RepID=A0A8J3AAZ6_9ACTN|nr:hypothetical protein [Egicoccus halophilus]GGI09062.1 hypothetical protein GCM10011354_32200 [Egicoccus halophilus]